MIEQIPGNDSWLDIADSVSIDAEAERVRQELIDDKIEMLIDFEREDL